VNFWRKRKGLGLRKRRKNKVKISCGDYQECKSSHGKNQTMVSNHSVKEIEPWYEEWKATIKEILEPYFDHSILAFHFKIGEFS